MRIVVDNNTFRTVLGHVQRAVERRNTIPILSNVLIRATAGTVSLKATDLDMEITEEMTADVPKQGEITLPAHLLYDIVRKLPDGAEASLELVDSMLVIKSGRSRFRLQTLPASDFPDLTAGTFTTTFSMAADMLRNLIASVEFAISTEETRYYLNGIYLHPQQSGNRKLTRMVTTDGHRLAQTQCDAPAGGEQFAGVIVPRKTVGEIGRLLGHADGDAKVEISDTKIRITIGKVVLTSKLIDGTFPDYTRVIPQGNSKTLIVDRASLRAAIDRVATITSERGRGVKLTLTAGKIELSTNNADHGSAIEELPAEYTAEALEIGFNSQYLMDVLGQITKDSVEFLFEDPGSPALVRDLGSEDTLFVLMPMRV